MPFLAPASGIWRCFCLGGVVVSGGVPPGRLTLGAYSDLGISGAPLVFTPATSKFWCQLYFHVLNLSVNLWVRYVNIGGLHN